MKNRTFFYRGENYEVVSTIVLATECYSIAKGNGKYSYFKHKVVNGRETDLSLDTLMTILPQYQTIGYRNLKNLLDAYMAIINQGESLEKGKTIFYAIYDE